MFSGSIISSCMAGIVFAKLARPKNRSHTVCFSKNAVITQRNGDLYLLLRVGNLRRSHLIEAHVRAMVIHHKRSTKEGETACYDTQELGLNTEMNLRKNSIQFDSDESEVSDSGNEDKTEDRCSMIWPFTIAHKIDKDSPFFAYGPKELLAAKFEMVVTLEGIVEPTGNSVQARTSYLPNEVLSGHRFQNMMSYKRKSGTYQVDFSYLNAVCQDDTPRISAKNISEKRKLEAKRIAMFRKKISSISMNSVKVAKEPSIR